MHEHTLLELKERRGRVATPVLLDRVLDGLARERVLQLGGGDRKTVDEEHEVDGLVAILDEPHLPSDDEPILLVLGERVGVHPVRRFEEGALDLLAEELEPVTKHVERSARIESLHERVEDRRFEPLRVMLAKLRPYRGLRRLDKGEQVLRDERRLAIEVGRRTLRPPAQGEQVVLDGVLEVALLGLRHHAPPAAVAFNFRNCFAHDAGGSRHIPSLRANAQTVSKLCFAQMSGLVWRHPTVFDSLSPPCNGKWYRFLRSELTSPQSTG